MTFDTVILLAGLGQLALLLAAVQVPARLHWRTELQPLSRTHRQMHWVYGGYVMLSIAAFAALTVVYTWAAFRAGDAL